MKTRILTKAAIILSAPALIMASCITDGVEKPRLPEIAPGTVTFVVSTPSPVTTRRATRAAVGEIEATTPETNPAGMPDTERYGTLFGGWPDAEAESAAFEKTVAAAIAKYNTDPAVKPGGVAEREELVGRINSASPASRAIAPGSDDDNRIEEMVILLFENNGNWVDVPLNPVKVGLTGEPAITDVAGNNQRKQFTLSSLEDGAYKAIFLANSRAAVTGYIGLYGPDGSAPDPTKMTIDGMRANLKVDHTMSPTRPWNSDPDDEVDIDVPQGDRPGKSDGVYRLFPMSSFEVSFSIPADRDYSRYPVELIRPLAKINVRVSPEVVEKYGFVIRQVSVFNYSATGMLIPATGWTGKNADLMDPAAINAVDDRRGYDDSLIRYTYPDEGVTEVVDEIFVWETSAINPDPITKDNWGMENFCLLVRGDYILPPGNGAVSVQNGAMYRIDLLKSDPLHPGQNPQRVNVVRNYTYDVTITDITRVELGTTESRTLRNVPSGLVVDIDAWDMEEPSDDQMNDNTWGGLYQLTADRSVVVLGPATEDRGTVRIYTDYQHGFKFSGMSEGNTKFAYSVADASANTFGSTTITFNSIEPNDTGFIRREYLSVMAGGLSKGITVIQLPRVENVRPVATSAVTDYAGAFWRADQTGERLIGLKPNVNWAAFTLDGPDGNDWVVMDNKPSRDAAVRTASPGANGNDDDFDSDHKVESTVNWAAGTTGAGGGYFRIGLRGSHAATEADPARYAVVLVAQGSIVEGNAPADHKLLTNTYRLIYLRQGHDADYVYSQNDPVNSGGLTARTVARRFSPYNVTAGSLNEPVNRQDDPDGPNPSRFTDYPSQAGAFFHWSNRTVPRVAWDPVSAGVATWNENDQDGFWDDISDENEVCPPGYRRPTDGPTDRGSDMTTAGDMALSEIRQSLYRAPVTGMTTLSSVNWINGYYADGWFDRRATEPSPTSVANSAVAASTNDVAYRGKLFYNASTGASLFLPAAGHRMRGTPDGTLTGAGNYLRYWTSSITGIRSDDNPWSLYASVSGSIMHDESYFRYMGYSIRCVKDVYDPKPGLLLAPPGVIGIKHSELEKPLNERTLTIRGSSTYRGTEVERNVADGPEFRDLGGLESEPVYVVYFKWGSTVGVIGGPSEDPFDPTDVVWVDPGRTGTINTWSDIAVSYVNTTGAGYEIPAHDPAQGIGDPCDLVLGATVDDPSGWKTPVGNPWRYSDGITESQPFGAGIQNQWGSTGIPARWIDVNYTGRTGGAGVSDNGLVWLVAAGYRNQNGASDNNSSTGDYWTATGKSTTGGYTLGFDRESVGGSGDAVRNYGFAVRCVRPVAPRPGLVQAPPGVIGIKHSELEKPIANRRLTLRGSSAYKGTWVERIATRSPALGSLENEPVYMVYFKWGSTVAMLGGADGEAFSSDDVVWVGDEYTGNHDSWSDFTASQLDGDTFINDPARGWGDACAAVRSDWNMPAGDPWRVFDGRYITEPFGDVNEAMWEEAPGEWRTVQTPHGAVSGPASDDGMIFLPAAGLRGTTGSYHRYDNNERGYYWSSTGTLDCGYILHYNRSWVQPSAYTDSGQAMPVRCQPLPAE